MDPSQYEDMAKRLYELSDTIDSRVKSISCIFNIPTHLVYNILIDVLRTLPGATEEE